MFLCGIIDELKQTADPADILAYFFSQATEPRLNNATAALRDLIYLLANKQPTLISHIQREYDHQAKALFEGINAWVALSELFTNIPKRPKPSMCHLGH